MIEERGHGVAPASEVDVVREPEDLVLEVAGEAESVEAGAPEAVGLLHEDPVHGLLPLELRVHDPVKWVIRPPRPLALRKIVRMVGDVQFVVGGLVSLQLPGEQVDGEIEDGLVHPPRHRAELTNQNIELGQCQPIRAQC